MKHYCVNCNQVYCYWHRPINTDVTNLGHLCHVWRLGVILKETKMELGRKFGNFEKFKTTPRKKKAISSVYTIQHSKTHPGYI